jgi:hypothetical protein
VHGFLGLKDIHVYKRDVDNQFSDIFKSNPALTPEGADLNRLRNEACYLMVNIHQKYLSLRVNDNLVQVFNDPFQIESNKVDDNASNSSFQSMSDDSSNNDDDSSWVPEEDDSSEIIDSDELSSHPDNVEKIGTNHVDHVGDNIFVRQTPNFSLRDSSVLEDTKKLLSPGDVIKYRLRHISEKPKSSTIVMLFDPSTPDKKSITLANGDIIRPFVHDVKREHMYAGGGGGLLFDPFSTWIKFEECTLNLGSANSVEDINTVLNIDEEYSMRDSHETNKGEN